MDDMTQVAADIIDTAAGEIRYWGTAQYSRSTSTLTVEDSVEGVLPVKITPEGLLAWLKQSEHVATLVGEAGDPYQKAAIRALAASDPEADWDAETADLLVQGIMFHGKIIYG